MIRSVPARALACAALVLLTSPFDAARAQGRPMSLDDIMDLRNVGGVDMAPNGKSILYTVNAWEHPAAKDTSKGDRHDMRSHVWLVDADGGEPRQLTFSERGESSPQWSPDGRFIAFISARGTGTGDDGPRPQVWVLRVDGGEAWKLTDVRDGVTSYAWSPDSRSVAFLSTDSLSRDAESRVKRKDDAKPYEADFRLTHVWVVDVATKQAQKLTSGNFTVRAAPTWSPDGTRLAVLTGPTPMIRDYRREAQLITIASRAMERVVTPEGMTPQTTPAWSPDGRTLAFAAQAETWKPNGDGIASPSLKNSGLMLYDVASKQAKDVSGPSFDASVGNLHWSHDGKTIHFTAQDRVYNSAFAYDVASGRYTQLSKQLMIRQPSFSDDGARVAFAMDSPESPADVYVADGAFSSPKKLSTVNPQVSQLALGSTEVVTWKSTDGWTVEGILLKPVGYQSGQRYPLLVDVHGGPTGAHMNGFKANWGSPGQYWAGRGWVVLYPNPRGSTGYGEKFMRANIKDWGGGDYRDIMTGVDDLVKRGIADSSRLAVTGWSYGGYMTGWIVSQTSRFKAAMMGAGLVDMVSMYGTTDIPGYLGSFYDGMPALDGSLTNKSLEFYRSRSAITYSDRVTTPLLMLHGGSDERVPIGQPMEMFRNLRDRGKTTELVFYPREGHGLGEYYHQMDKVRREFDWITRYTLGEKPKVLQ